MAVAMLGCMDRRMNAFFDEQYDRIKADNPDEDIYIVRDAGGCIKPIALTLTSLYASKSVRDIRVFTHTDCNAMKFVLESMGKRTRTELREAVSDMLFKQIYASRNDAEEINTQIQRTALEGFQKFAPNISVSCEKVDIERFNVPVKKGKLLCIGLPFSGKYFDIAEKYDIELSDAYFVQANNVNEARHAVILAVEELGIHDVRFVSNKPSEYNILETWRKDASLLNMFARKEISVPPIMQKGKLRH